MKKKKISILLTALAVSIALSCCSDNSQSNYYKSHVNQKKHNNKADKRNIETFRCFEYSIDSIINYPMHYLKQDDSCVLELISKLSQTYLTNSDEKLLAGLEALSKNSDGYVSESLGTTFYEMFETKTYDFVICINRRYDNIVKLLVSEIVIEEIGIDKIKENLNNTRLSEKEKTMFIKKIEMTKKNL